VEHEIAVNLATYINPALVLLFLIVTPMGATPREILRFVITSAVALLVTYLLALIGQKTPVWPGHPHFPSGHAAFGAAVAARISWRRAALMPFVGIALAALGWGLVMAPGHYHTPVEVVAGLALGILVTVGVHRLSGFLAPIVPEED
jgi:membrane-associated phospholipid phosphatase